MKNKKSITNPHRKTDKQLQNKSEKKDTVVKAQVFTLT